MPPGRNLARATLAVHRPPAGSGGRAGEVPFQFNPSQVQLSRSASWHSEPAVAFQRGATPEFAGSQPASMQLELFLDASVSPGGSLVRTQVEKILSCCEVDPQTVASAKPETPWVRFSWGSFTTVQFAAHVESVSVAYTLFSAGGEPLRATCQLSLREIPLPAKGQNPTSGALSARRVHQVVAGDSLAALAWREYGDATVWRVIAEANDIDDPMRLSPGRELLLPAADEVPAARYERTQP
ncbi:peptidase M23 [Actinoplanes philippinensis]|uniref:LysM domain-containing protein n=1 Tax=Actinoplanes philippinensis TaxID=35752 RepID=A0A1I2HEM8_9ACTN|nr:LysM peptidoglycan-binding domain-containing protein [Actinoplanes philippinensis]GIE81768.1 peptidase M23 [Actinoplanes philippinensis]SFF28634.1 LysM domain-containing protein [Actinoplanes philippinensis]